VLKRKRHVVVPWWYWIPINLYQRFPALVERAMLRSLRPSEQVIAEQQSARQAK